MKSIRTVLACIRKADQKYSLINHGDKIILGLSGGKDSVALLYALSLYQKFSHTDFTLQPVTLDLGFPGFNPQPMEQFCEQLGYKLIVSDSRDVYKILQAHQEDANHLPCSICSRMKKAAINKVANELGFNKVCFAHHADDAVETLLMNEIFGARIATFSPQMHLENANITFIRPLILVRENEIEKLVKEEKLPICSSHCPADKLTTREDIKTLLNDIYKKYPESKSNFLTMLDNYAKEDTWGKELSYQINQNGLSLVPVTTISQYIDVRYVRTEVFVKEFKISIEDEFDSLDKDASHFLITLNKKTIGTIRYRKTENGFKLERIAILKEYRNKGYGAASIMFLADMIGRDFNPCRIYIHAMSYLIEFYTKLGFKEKGSHFMEANIDHVEMEMFY